MPEKDLENLEHRIGEVQCPTNLIDDAEALRVWGFRVSAVIKEFLAHVNLDSIAGQQVGGNRMSRLISTDTVPDTKNGQKKNEEKGNHI